MTEAEQMAELETAWKAFHNNTDFSKEQTLFDALLDAGPTGRKAQKRMK